MWPSRPLPSLLRDRTRSRSLIESMLADKRAVVLYGPPGTGKTKTATELTEHFTGAQGEYEVVVFHASYSYEDFVEGLRPRASSSGIDYPVVDGPLKRLAGRARDWREEP